MSLAETSAAPSIERSAVVPWPSGIPQNAPDLLQFLNDLQNSHWEKRAQLAQSRDPRFDRMRELELALGPLTWTNSTQSFNDPQVARNIQELKELYEPSAVSGARRGFRRLLGRVGLGS